MRHKPTEAEAKQSLQDHVGQKAYDAREAYSHHIDASSILDLLTDSRFVRYPVAIKFNADYLQQGEFAYMDPNGGHPEEGFTLYIHPFFEQQLDALPLLIAYHLVCVNYGDIATSAEAEIFGATLLGMETETYYQKLCQLADSIPY